MKALRKQLIAAVAMVLISAIALSSSTYAWFSMNTTVTATGMQVTAKSNATYLLIDKVDNATDKTTSADTMAALTASATLYPAGYNETADPVTVGGYSVPAGGWYTASNANSDDADDAIKNGKAVTLDDSDYMLKNTFYLTLSTDSEAYTGDLKVTFTRESGDAAICAVVIIQGHTYDFTTTATNNQFTVTASTLTSTTSIPVTVYTYVNGDSTDVYSDFINDTTTNPNGITGEISLTFDLVPTA